MSDLRDITELSDDEAKPTSPGSGKKEVPVPKAKASAEPGAKSGKQPVAPKTSAAKKAKVQDESETNHGDDSGGIDRDDPDRTDKEPEIQKKPPVKQP